MGVSLGQLPYIVVGDLASMETDALLSEQEPYLHLHSIMSACLKRLDLQILEDMDRYKLEHSNAIFLLLFEVQKGLALCCCAIEVQAYSQVATLLRQLLEQISTVKVLIELPESQAEYQEFYSLRLNMIEQNTDKSPELDKRYDIKCKTKKLKHSKQSFYEFGWMLRICDDYGIEKLMQLAKIEDLAVWRKFFNNFVHTKITYTLYKGEAILKEINRLIYHIAIVFDLFMCCYHNYGHQNFVFHRNFRKEFQEAFTATTQLVQANI